MVGRKSWMVHGLIQLRTSNQHLQEQRGASTSRSRGIAGCCSDQLSIRPEYLISMNDCHQRALIVEHSLVINVASRFAVAELNQIAFNSTHPAFFIPAWQVDFKYTFNRFATVANDRPRS